MTRSRFATLADDAAMQLEVLLPPEWRGLVALSLGEAETGSIETLPAAARISVTVPSDRALLRGLTLPQGTDTRRAVALWLEDGSPWAQGSYLWDVVQKSGAEWQVAIFPEGPVRQAEERLERRGSTVGEIRLAAPDGTLFMLRPDQAGRGRLRRGLLAVVGLVTALGLGLALWQGQAALAARSVALKAQDAAEALHADGQYGTLTAAALALRTEKLRVPGLAAKLDFLARHLPTDTWLLHLALEGPRFAMSGRSTGPEAIIPSLSLAEGAVSTARVDFDGPMTRDLQNGLYSFAITGEFVGAGDAQ